MNDRQAGREPEMRECFGCHRRIRKDRAKTIDISQPDEYYPTVRYLCWDCNNHGDSQSANAGVSD